MSNATQTPIDKARQQQQIALAKLSAADCELRAAQNAITYVEGKGSSKIYDDIAELYQQVGAIRQRLAEMNVTGLFE